MRFSLQFLLSFVPGLSCAAVLIAFALQHGEDSVAGVGDVGRLRRVGVHRSSANHLFQVAPAISAAELAYLQSALADVVEVFAYAERPVLLRDPAASRLDVAYASPGLLAALGVRLSRGHHPRRDAAPQPAVILSDRLWQRLYQRHDSAIGAYATSESFSAPIVAISTQHFRGVGLAAMDLWVEASHSQSTDDRYDLFAILLLPAGASDEAVQSRLDAIAAGNPFDIVKLTLQPLTARPFGDNGLRARAALIAIWLSAAATILMLINGVLLTSVHVQARRTSLALRAALGASPSRLFGHAVGLSLTLVALSTLVAAASVQLLTGLVARLAARDLVAAPQPTLLVVGLGSVSLVVLAASVVPAIVRIMDRPRPVRVEVAQHGRSSVLGVVVAHAAAVALVATIVSPLIAGFIALRRAGPGFATDNAAVIRVETSSARPLTMGMAQQLLSLARAAPEIQSAAVVTAFPYLRTSALSVRAPDGSEMTTHVIEYLGDAVAALGLQTLSGAYDSHGGTYVNQRFFSSHATHRAGVVCIGATGACSPIRGVVRNTDVVFAGESPLPVLYREMDAAPAEALFLVVRFRSAPGARSLQALNDRVALQVPFALVETIRLAQLVAQQRAFARATAAAGVVLFTLSFCLAISGLLSTVRHALIRRRHEMGVRAALGASPFRLAWTILRPFTVAVVAATLAAAGAGVLLGRALIADTAGTRGLQITAAATVAVTILLVVAHTARAMAQLSPSELLMER